MSTLREAGIALTLPEIVALYDAGDLAMLLPAAKDGRCEWCMEAGAVWDTQDRFIKTICRGCLVLAMEMIRAMVASDQEAYAFWEGEINSRQRIAGDAIH